MINDQEKRQFLEEITKEIETVLKQKKYPQELYDYLLAITIGMILKYGKNYKNEILEVITTTQYICSTKELDLIKNSSLIEQINNKLDHGINIFTLFNTKIENTTIKINYIICILNKESYNNINILEYLVYELNQIFLSKKTKHIKDKNKTCINYGLYKRTISNNGIITEQGKTLNEIINNLLSEDIIKEILSLRKYNLKINALSRILKKTEKINETTFTTTEYQNETNLLRPLYKQNGFKDFVTSSMLQGNIEDIALHFNEVLGNNAYSDISSKLDDVSKHFALIKNFGNNNLIHETAAKCCIIRETIQNFINKKYSTK